MSFTRLASAIGFSVCLLAAGCAAPAPEPTAPTAPPAPQPASTASPPKPTAQTAPSSGKVAYPITLTDATGKTFTFDRPQKLGCVWVGCSEMLSDFGLPIYAASYTGPNVLSYSSAPTHVIADSNNPEHWAAAGVDLIVHRVPAIPSHEPLAAAAPIFYMHAWDSSSTGALTEYVTNYRLMGQLVDAPGTAEQAIARFETFTARLKEMAPARAAASRTAVLFAGDGYVLMTQNQPFCVVLAQNNMGQCVATTSIGSQSTIELSGEEFLRFDPDWIVYQGTGSATRADPVWKQLEAVRDGHVYDAGNRYYCCSFRALIHALQEYAHYVFAPDVAVPNPGPVATFDPLTSPLLGTATASSAFPLTITDAVGQTYTFQTPPRLACYWTGCLELLADLGVVPYAGGEAFSRSAPGAMHYPLGLPTHLVADTSNPEHWAATGVDLIINRVPSSPTADALAAAAPVFYMHAWNASGRGGSENLDNLRTMGQLTGRPEAAAAAIGRYEQAIAKLKRVAPPTAANNTVAVLFSGDALRVLAKNQPFCVLIEQHGFGRCIETPSIVSTSGVELNAEEMLRLDPDWVVHMGSDGSTYRNRTLPAFKQLRAVASNQVYDTTFYYYCCSQRNLIGAIEEFAHYTFGPQVGIPLPGRGLDYDPARSAFFGTP
jgi:ABC-type Fe3+-hydroxamate transport system substrate-binding protein